MNWDKALSRGGYNCLSQVIPLADEIANEMEYAKKLIREKSDDQLKYALMLCVEREEYELAAYVRDTAAKRGFKIELP